MYSSSYTLLLSFIFYDYTPEPKAVQQVFAFVPNGKFLLEKHEKRVLFINCMEIPFEVNL